MDTFHVDRGEGFMGPWKVLLCRISQGEGILGLMGVECRSRRSSSSELPDSCVVLYTVFMVLTCHLIKPLAQGSGGKR